MLDTQFEKLHLSQVTLLWLYNVIALLLALTIDDDFGFQLHIHLNIYGLSLIPTRQEENIHGFLEDAYRVLRSAATNTLLPDIEQYVFIICLKVPPRNVCT